MEARPCRRPRLLFRATTRWIHFILLRGSVLEVGIQHGGGNRQSRIRNDAPTKVEESRRCVPYSQKAYTKDGPGGENNKLTLGSLA